MVSPAQISLTLTLLLAAGCSTIQSVEATALDPMEADIQIEIGDTLAIDMKNQTEIRIVVTDIDESIITGRAITVNIEDQEPQLSVIPRDEIETIVKIETEDQNYRYESTVETLEAIYVIAIVLAGIVGLIGLL